MKGFTDSVQVSVMAQCSTRTALLMLMALVPKARAYSCIIDIRKSALRREPSVRTWRSMSTQGLDEGSVNSRGFVGAIYKLSRPHTIRGTMLASIAGVAKALTDSGGVSAVWQWELLPRAILGAIALLCSNAWIVGVNQIFDVEVDKVNKPFLPIAAGELSKRTAWILLSACAIVGPAIVLSTFSPLIFGLYAFGTLIGTAYSVPPFKLKSRGPLYAGVSIAVCRGFLLNFGVYYATLEALGQTFRWSPPVAFMARFMTVFAAVIAITKDLPDVEGDRRFKLETFATRLGPNRVAKLAAAVLALNYASAVAQAALSPPEAFRKINMIIGHLALAALLGRNLLLYLRNAQDNLSTALKVFYKQVWDLFYLEYALYVFI